MFADWYLPGSKGGGAVAAIANLIQSLGDEFCFFLITRDRDNTDDRPYASVCSNRWVEVGKAKVLYTSNLSFRHMLRRIEEVDPELVHLNSYFSRFTMKFLLLRRGGLLRETPVILAPQGEFSPGALELKPVRKRLYGRSASFFGLYRGLIWQAASLLEKEHISGLVNGTGNKDLGDIVVASDLPDSRATGQLYSTLRPPKRPGEVRFIFLSRISRKKNLHFALEILKSLSGAVEFDMYGPVEDEPYWERCRRIISELPDNIHVRYNGAIAPGEASHIFSQFHFQILPTRGENFGYVILESLVAGCPVAISDQTPWRNLSARGVGWDLPLADRNGWIQALQQCVDMNQETYESSSRSCQVFVDDWLRETPCRSDMVQMYNKALKKRPNASPADLQASVEIRD
jgi:glycosyltransferase involved in cell wall biosynthesis